MYRHQDNKFTERKHTRLQNYDYSTENYYFVTICTHEKKCIFGSPDTLNWCGKFAKMGIENIPLHYEGVKVLQFVIMPNHVHMIIALPSKIFELSMIIGQYKAFVTKNIRHNDPSAIVWQRSFHDHVIRNQHSYEKIWQYIE